MVHTLSRSASPRDLLGSEHPFTRANDALAVVRRQAAAVGLVLLGSMAGLILGVGQGVSLVIGASRPEQLEQLAANVLEVRCQSCGATVTFTPPEVARQCDRIARG